MPINEKKARDIYAKVLSIYPSNLEMSVYVDEDALREDIGQQTPDPCPAAFYSAGVLYVRLDKFDDEGMAAFIITHEVGHQVFDPGSIFCGYIAWRLWMKVYKYDNPNTPEKELWMMQGAQNIYSDIVVNRSFWKNPALRKLLGEDGLKNAIMKWYAIYPNPQKFVASPDKFFKANFLQANMSLGYLEVYRPSDFNLVMQRIQDPDLKAVVETINLLVNENGLAVKNIQGYYDVTVPFYSHLFRLVKKEFRRVLVKG